MASVVYEPIGVIHTPFRDKASTPIQGVYDPESRGLVEVFPKYADGLKDIGGFSHLILLYHFHLAERCSLWTKPFLDNEKKGIFSIRHFNRPNPLGLSIVRLFAVANSVLEVGEVDILDGTPLLDIKPYTPDFDIRLDAKRGWYEGASNRQKYERNKGRQRCLDDS